MESNELRQVELEASFPDIHFSVFERSWRILIVARTEGCGGLVQELPRYGHQVATVDTGTMAMKLSDRADLLLLDPDLPDFDGFAVCRSIRARHAVPIILVTDRTSELDCVLGLSSGADDYLARPFGISELVARIDSVMRRACPELPVESASVTRCGSLRIDEAAREIDVHGRPIVLTKKEFDLLCLLARRPGVVVPRHQILREVWDGSWSHHTVDTHVSSLRAKLGSSDWIVAVRGIGFKLMPIAEISA
ncbi:response regulator [Nocardia sp. SYP-A9097]|uniref:response regulator transcription factor n=1 Tax=Nocardia sp. SYP-A9097 TaxID=2663237 RepID=UPI00129ADB52|nr:response regulator transcription factor [Nocardia sp. SYP-A9097]MRH90112.1 response regulator [Nocardia sp. SYP-A9097]